MKEGREGGSTMESPQLAQQRSCTRLSLGGGGRPSLAMLDETSFPFDSARLRKLCGFLVFVLLSSPSC